MKIRDAVQTDAPVIQSIYAFYVKETAISFEMTPPTVDEIRARMSKASQRLPWLVAAHNGQVVGYAYASRFREREAYKNSVETTVYVHPERRRTGVGRTLMVELLARLRVAKFHRVIAGVTLPNAGSVGLHQAMGFESVGVFTEVGRKFDVWHDVGFWELKLP